MASLNVQREDEVALTIQNLLNCEKEGERRGSQLPPTISMVPKVYRDQNPSCFDPQMISIGPLHRKHENVQELEALKATYLHDLLARLDSPPKEILETCLSKVLSSIDEIKVCYGGMMNYTDFELANMMLIDACFILEYLKKFLEGKVFRSGNPLVMVNVMRDLVLLENQIPFFVLNDIFDNTLLKFAQSTSLITLLKYPLNVIKPFKARLTIDRNSNDRYYYKHILDVMHKAYHPACVIPSPHSKSPISHSAVELDLVGVNFKPNLDDNWPLAIKYESSGLLCFRRSTLRMPILNIEDHTEQVLRNLIAYEQSSSIYGHYFTSYAWAMDLLVFSSEDVIKLTESNVIDNILGSNERAINLINKISNQVLYTEFHYESEWKEIDDHYNRYWRKNIARLRRTYFSTPWNMIALVAGILLFALTVIQTYLAFKSTP